MARVEYREFPQVGKGFRIITQSIPPTGIIPVLRAAREGKRNIYRFSRDGGESFTEWQEFTTETRNNLGRLTDSANLVLDYVTDPYRTLQPLSRSVRMIDPTEPPLSSIFYDKTIFKLFFDSNDPQVLAWALNVLEKLFEPGIVPTYVSRDNEDDYNTFFFTITHFFAFVVIYARQYREFTNFGEDSTISGTSREILLKQFLEGWGIVYENIVNDEQREYLFKNWMNQFRERGTYNVVSTDGEVVGELRRLVGYTRPNEFIFGVLAPQDVGWCMGWSSPTWTGTETVNAVSKGFDFGPDYAGDSYGNEIAFDADEVVMENTGDEVEVNLVTKHHWNILENNDDVPSDLYQASIIGVNKLEDYPLIGDVERKYEDNMYVLRPTGTGRCGVASETDLTKLMEVYVGLDYEITVWVKAESEGAQNIEFGVNCFDANMNPITQIRLTNLEKTNSFFLGDEVQNPCKVPGIYYRLRGIIYNIETERDETLYLNFENGRPLRFLYGDNGEETKYMAPYIVQNRTGNVTNISIAGIVLKPLDLPFSQGFLGQKNVIAMYSQIRSARTKDDIETFIRRYLVSYKNVVSYTWLDWVTRTSWFLTFDASSLDGTKLAGVKISLDNGLSSETDSQGYLRFELPFDKTVTWTAEYEGIIQTGSVFMNRDQKITVQFEKPIFVTLEVVESGYGTVEIIDGVKLGNGWKPRTEITLQATPNPGYSFLRYNIEPDSAVDTRNPTNYFLGDHDITVRAEFEISADLHFSPAEVVIPATGGIGTTIVSSTKKWALDALPEDWASVSPMSGDAGDTPLQIEIDEQG